MSRAYKSEVMAAVHEMMEGFHESGAIDKQTMCEFDDACLRKVPNAETRAAMEESRAIMNARRLRIREG